MARKAAGRTGKAKAKRPRRSRPLVAESGSVRRAPRARRQRTNASPAASPLDVFSLMQTMQRVALVNIDHAGRLAACRTPMEFWLEHMRFGQSLMAQWQSATQRALLRPMAR